LLSDDGFGEAAPQVKAARKLAVSDAVFVEGAPSCACVPRFGADLEGDAEMGGDELRLAAADEGSELFPVCPEGLFPGPFELPEEGSADAALWENRPGIGFDRDPEDFCELVAHAARLPLGVGDVGELNSTNEGRFSGAAVRAHRDRFQLDAELGEIRERFGGRAGAEELLDERADETFGVELRVRHLLSGNAELRRELRDRASCQSARSFEQLGWRGRRGSGAREGR
jgi:hypothetical protein